MSPFLAECYADEDASNVGPLVPLAGSRRIETADGNRFEVGRERGRQ